MTITGIGEFRPSHIRVLIARGTFDHKAGGTGFDLQGFGGFICGGTGKNLVSAAFHGTCCNSQWPGASAEKSTCATSGAERRSYVFDRRLERVLWNDPATGMMRHVDAGYDIALECARDNDLKLPAILGK